MDILVVQLSPLNNLDSAVMRTIGVMKGFIQLGHEITFLSVSGNSGTVTHDFENDDDLKKATIIYAAENEIKEKLWRHPKDRSLRGVFVNVLRKVFHKFSVLGSTSKIAKRVNVDVLDKKYYDIIISSSDPKTSHKAVNSLIESGLKYGKWIEYWGDPLVADITQQSIYPNRILRKIESNLFYKADSIVYVSPVTLDAQKKLYPKFAQKMSLSVIPYMRPKTYPFDTTGRFHVSYIGSYFSKYRNLTPFYDAMLELGEEYCTNIIGDSDLSLEPTETIAISQRQYADTIEAKSNLLVCLLNKRGTQIPGKIYHCAATNLPTLIITDGEYADQIVEYFSNFDRFYFCSNSEEDIANAIKMIKEDAREERPSKEFSPIKVAESFI